MKTFYRSKRLLLLGRIRNAYQELNDSGFKIDNGIVVHSVMDFDGFAAYLTIFYVSLVGDRGIEHHRDDLPTVRAREEELHVRYIIKLSTQLLPRLAVFVLAFPQLMWKRLAVVYLP